MLNSPLHSVQLAITKYLCLVQPLNNEKLPCAGQGQELWVNIAVPPLPELWLHKFHLCAIPGHQNQRKDPLERSTLWIFSDPLVICPNQTALEMMLSIEILMEHFHGLIFPLTQGQEHVAKDLELMPQYYIILMLEVVHE